MTMVHVAACEAIKGGRYRDHFSRVDTHRIFPAQFVRIERPMPLKADGYSRCPRCWMEAVLVVQISAQRLKLHEMHMEGMGVFRHIKYTPNLCRTIGHEPVDGILKLPGDGAVAHGFSLLICYRHERFSCCSTSVGHLSQFMEGEHAVGILDHRDHSVLVCRGQPVMFEPAIRRGQRRGQDERVIHRPRGDTELHHLRMREPVLQIWCPGWLGRRTVIERCAGGVDQGQPLPRQRAKVDDEISTLRWCKQQSIPREVNRLPEQAAIGPDLLDLLMDRAPAFIEQHQAVEACVGSVEQPQRSEEHTSELQSRRDLVCRLLLEKKKKVILPSMAIRITESRHNNLS